MWACSMGGILVKEMLNKALSEMAPPHHRQLAAATSGLVFYACPHLGSNLANIGWNLRYVGASPAASVVHLKPGKHLEVVPQALDCSTATCMHFQASCTVCIK